MFSRSGFGCRENSDPGKQIKKKEFKLVSIVLSKMFYRHAMVIGGNSMKGLRYFVLSDLSLSRPVDKKKLTSI